MNPAKKNILIVSLAVLIAGISNGQQLSISPARFTDDQDVVSIIDMTQNSRGQIWIATGNNGLCKYDGIRLTYFTPEISNLSSTPVVTRMENILSDSEDRIWIGTFQDGMQQFNPETETFTSFVHDPNDNASISSDSVRALLEDGDGILWIGTVRGLDIFDVNTGEFTRFIGNTEDAKLLAKDHVRNIYKDKSGILWVSCGSPFFDDNDDPSMGGLYRLDVKTGEVIRYKHIENDSTSLINNRVKAVFEDSRGVFWVGTSGDGLHTMNREKGTFTRLQYDPENPQKPSRPPINNSYNYVNDHITFINEDAAGYVWIGTFSGGLNRYNPHTNTVQHYGTDEPEPFKLERNDYWCSLVTRDNLFWISGWDPRNNNQILYKMSTRRNQFNFETLEKWATCFFEEDNGTLWIGGVNEIHRKNTDGEYTSYQIPRQSSNYCYVINMEPDEKSNLWLSTNRGLYRFNKTTANFKEYKYYENLKLTATRDTVAITTFVNNDGTIWIGTTIGLILMNPETGEVKRYQNDASKPASLSNNIVGVLYKDKEENLWAGTNTGLNLYNPEAENFDVKIGQQSNITCIYQDQNEIIWIGTANTGLFQFNPQSHILTQFNDSTHLLANSKNIFGISEDHENSLWINSNKGFIRLNPDTKVAELFGNSWEIQPENLASQVYTLKNGKILIGEQSGYYSFHPADLQKYSDNRPNPFISKLFIEGNQVIPGVDDLLDESLSSTREITIAYNQNNFALEFDCIDFLTDPLEKNQLFKLENYDQVWRQKGGEDKTYYYNVPPGRYVFRFKAVNLYGIWGEKSLIINITPPWYKTALAYIVFALLLLLAIYLTHKFQRGRVIKAERKKALEKELIQAREIEKAYNELKVTQQQLIQSEKMASLGELTAGIAHEIQNPLNFVNNFSEVNSELIDDLKEAIANNDKEEIEAIFKDLKENENKVAIHGKRAEAIVKGMLMHSRGNSGKKEPTDINALCDEYLRLSYHGFRAKDKSFNAEYKLEIDKTLPKAEVVPQDIGRLLLNLINNAFYAVSQRQKTLRGFDPTPGLKNNGTNYKPMVNIVTHGKNGTIEIRIKDNGNGIPEEIKNKIFQPFFTTKPTGLGTGLGLSLSYDIVKAHGGSLNVETVENIGSEFIIQLPVNQF